MKVGKYTVKELFVNRYLKQIVIPEIQRDYVWGKDQLTKLLNSIKSDFNRYQNFVPPVQVTEDSELEKAFQEFCQKRDCASNIGFIYAYNDEEYPGRYFLIDGQQRITSMYLVLLTLASRNDELKEPFKKTYIFDQKLKIDYKVREASHDFLFKLVPFMLEGDGYIEDQHWFYADSENDITSKNLFQNIGFLEEYFDENPVNEISFYQYLEDFTEFWYFDTNVSEQGEELYIYMNARGEQMQSNENIKADLLSKEIPVKKNNYGRLWEEWQDFFWLNKGSNENADNGFNEFLTCIAGLENYKNNEKQFFYSKEKFDKRDENGNYGIKVEDILTPLDLSSIQNYVNGFQYLIDNKEKFKTNYQYSDWVDRAFEKLWEIINDGKTNWFADYSDENRATERSKMVYAWSVLYYLSEKVNSPIISYREAFRVLRIFYLRLNNFDRSVSGISKNVKELCEQGPWKAFSNPEEHLKHSLYNEVKPDEVSSYEELIWQIEDHKFNLDGSDVGAINISHLVNFNEQLDLNKLRNIKEKFFEIFPEQSYYYHSVQNALLYYGWFAYRVSPPYYTNFHFGNWRRIIRDVPEDKTKVRNAFKSFFAEFLNFSGNLNDFIVAKRANMMEPNEATNLREKLLWYSQYIGNKMWERGNYIAISHGNYCGLPDYSSMDEFFKDGYAIYNFKGDLRGGNPTQLFDLLPEEVKEKYSVLETTEEPVNDELN